MRIGVTGANGMVGRVLRARLSRDKSLKGRYLQRRDPAGPEDIRSPELGIGSADDWHRALDNLDTVVHLAAALPWHGRSADDLRQVNTGGTEALAEGAARAGVRRFVYVSTLGVHGLTSAESPFTPDSPIAPSGAYAESKYEAERSLMRDHAQRMELVILRPPVVYGPGVGGKIGMLSRRIANGKRLPLGPITTNRRQMIGAANLADAILLAVRSPDAPGAPLLPADAEAVSTHTLLTLIAEAHGKPLRLAPIPVRALRLVRALPGIGGLVERLVGNVELHDTRLRRLGWTPPVALRDGIAQMIAAERKVVT